MKRRIVATHNPQDFFEGNEPEQLTVSDQIEISNRHLQKMLSGGYVVIVMPPDNANREDCANGK